jgi:hypothetical protein
VPLLAAWGLVHGAAGGKRYHVPSPAMRPTFRQDTTVTAKTLKAGDYRPVDGDVVVLRRPADVAARNALASRWTGPNIGGMTSNRPVALLTGVGRTAGIAAAGHAAGHR